MQVNTLFEYLLKIILKESKLLSLAVWTVPKLFQAEQVFNPIQTGVGEGRILPAVTLDGNHLFNVKANATRLFYFF